MGEVITKNDEMDEINNSYKISAIYIYIINKVKS